MPPAVDPSKKPHLRNQATAATARPVGRPSRAEAAALGEQVLQAARQQFLAQGYHDTSLELIARTAGVHRDTLYRQHGSKEQLFRTVLAAGMRLMREGIERAVGRGGPPEKVLPRVARQLYADVASSDTLALTRMVVAEARRFPDLASQAHADWVIDLAPLITYLAGQRAAGRLQMDDPAEAAYTFSNVCCSTLRLLMTAPLTGALLEAHLERSVALFLGGWAPR